MLFMCTELFSILLNCSNNLRDVGVVTDSLSWQRHVIRTVYNALKLATDCVDVTIPQTINGLTSMATYVARYHF